MRMTKVGSVEIPVRGALDIETAFEWLGGETILRTVSGAGIKQETWRKLRITISGSGWIPAGLDAIDSSQQQVVACGLPVAINCDSSRQATLPTTRRNDTGYAPWAWALLPDASIQETPVAIVANVATADAVVGAVGYQVLYFPQITAWISRPTSSGDQAQATYRWELIAEQV